jgi:hypothetical protein
MNHSMSQRSAVTISLSFSLIILKKSDFLLEIVLLNSLMSSDNLETEFIANYSNFTKYFNLTTFPNAGFPSPA